MDSLPSEVPPQSKPRPIRRWFYEDSIADFLRRPEPFVLGHLSAASTSVEKQQINAWQAQITLLQEALKAFDSQGCVYFEYVIPRLGKRIDCVLLLEHVLFVLEFKAGERLFNNSALDQVWDYALDLRPRDQSRRADCSAAHRDGGRAIALSTDGNHSWRQAASASPRRQGPNCGSVASMSRGLVGASDIGRHMGRWSVSTDSYHRGSRACALCRP